MSEYMLGASAALNRHDPHGRVAGLGDAYDRHELTALHGLTHGASAGDRHQRRPARAPGAEAAENCSNTANGSGALPTDSEEERIDRTLEATEKFFRSLGLSTRLSEEGIGETTIAEIERRFNASGVKYGEAQNVDGAVARRILEACM